MLLRLSPLIPQEPPAESQAGTLISLDEMRRRRAPEGEGGGGPPSGHQRQAQVLQECLRSGRLEAADLYLMIRLGLVTDQAADRAHTLPCHDRHRGLNARDWEYQASRYTEDPTLPPPAPPSQVSCPLLSQVSDDGRRPACQEALRQRGQLPRAAGAEAAEDPVEHSELRPCQLLGRELLLRFLVPSL